MPGVSWKGAEVGRRSQQEHGGRERSQQQEETVAQQEVTDGVCCMSDGLDLADKCGFHEKSY